MDFKNQRYVQLSLMSVSVSQFRQRVSLLLIHKLVDCCFNIQIMAFDISQE